jgi:hypothetical protein
MHRKHIWLCLPPILACLFDNVLTLWNQPATYWAGDYLTALEAAPHGRWLLVRHPLAFEAAMLGYILLFCYFILYLPRWLAMIVGATIVLGHLTGACTWIAYERPLDGYWLSLGLCVCAAVLLVVSFQMTLPPTPLPEPEKPATLAAPPREFTPYREPFSTN